MSTESLDHIPFDWLVEHSGERLVVDYDRVAELIQAAKRVINAPHSAARDEAIADMEALLAPPRS